MNQLINSDEKKALFDRVTECENKINDFTNEGLTRINDTIHQINGLIKRVTDLEKKNK